MYHSNRLKINNDWRFRFEAEAPESVTLPHTWNALDTMEPDPENRYRRGTAVYARPFDPAPSLSRRRFVQVDAAAMTAEVSMDGILLGRHVGGYTAFDVALPPAGGQLRIVVDNTPDPQLIPSDMSDFFLYGGLTRNVWLYETGAVRLVSLHVVTEWEGDTAILTIHGACDELVDGTELVLQLADGAGTAVVEASHSLSAKSFTFTLPPISNPARWSPDQPTLYTLTANVHCHGQLSDEVVERIGFRTYAFPEGGPFYLNGERLLLRGTHRHEDWAGLGAAVPDALSRQELAQIKAAGFNFIRLGHYPQAEAVLDACDELGIIVWEEIPWCRGGIGNDWFKSQARTMLHEMIDQHFNRPSIIFWGMGNELDWESEHPETSDDDVYAFLQELHDLSHQLDPSRLTALRRYDRGADIVDVYSPSIWSGWYRGRYEDYEAVLRDAMARFPRLLHTEWGGDSHVGRHNSGPHLRRQIANHTTHEENPGVALSSEGEARASLDGDWSESYILDLMEWHLQVQNRLPNLAGTAQWVFKDFGTPLRPENPIPYVNQKGLVDRSGTPKDVYYLFQAYQTNTPVCHIESPTWPVRTGEPGALKRVRVYSNGERVELFVNGRSQGTKFPNPDILPAGGLVWFVPLQLGSNEIRATALTTDGQVIEHRITQTLVPNGVTTAAGMRGWFESPAPADWTPASYAGKATLATVQLVTPDGTAVLTDERRLTFSLSGKGQLLTNQGTPSGSRVVETANGRASILLLDADATTQVLVRSDGLPAIQIGSHGYAPADNQTKQRSQLSADVRGLS